jgi:biotin transport system substrate-specific component
MLFANIVLIYIPGLLQLHLWLRLVGGEAIGFYQVLAMGFLPFIIGDIVKAVTAAAITRGITPKKAYNGEVDKDKWSSWRIP